MHSTSKKQYEEISDSEYSKMERKKRAHVRTWKDPKGHVHEIKIAGDYEAIVFYCQACHIAYKIQKSRVESLPVK